MPKKTAWSEEQALTELKRWCALQERSHMDVRTKLIEHRIYGEKLEEIIATLISEDFINELRFATAYVSGKFKINEWGRNKIIMGLKQKQISTYNINKAMSQIDDDQYIKTLDKHFKEKSAKTGLASREAKAKVMNYLLQKGFEQHLILQLINEDSYR